MKLQSVGVINWANLPSRNYKFSEITLITGESGAGKTTLLDAIQTIMTAATAGLYQYNPGQEEAPQQSRTKETRTIASYFLGCDDGAYSRPDGAHGYLIANWVPEMGETSDPFCAVVGCTAYLDTAGSRRTGKEETLVFALVRSFHLDVSNFQTTDPAGKQHIVPVKQLAVHFKKHYPQYSLEMARGKEDYLCKLYGALRGQGSVNKIEARGAAKALSKFMVYKKLDNLDEFVRRDILEPYDLSDAIRQVSSMMRTINEMEQEAHKIENGVGFLDAAEKSMSGFIQTAVDEQLAGYERLYRGGLQLGRKHTEMSEASRQLSSEIKTYINEQAEITGRLDQLADELRDLEMRRHGYGVLEQKERLQRELDELEKGQAGMARELLMANHQRAVNRELALKLDEAASSDAGIYDSPQEEARWEKRFAAVIENDAWEGLPLNKLLAHGGLEELSQGKAQLARTERSQNELEKALKEKRSGLNQAFFQAQENVIKLSDRHKRLEDQVSQLEVANQVPYPYEVKRALKLISDHYPEADPQVLCDHVEVIDDAWQVAVEGLLGNNRFLIMVDPEYEARAIKLIEPYGLSKSAVIQGKKAARDVRRHNPAEDSLHQLLRFSHFVAENYFKAAYGNVKLVDDAETLSRTPRGLMKNGMASGGYKMFIVTISEAELVFGRTARQRSAKAQKEQLEKLETQLTQANKHLEVISLWQDAANKVAPVLFSGPLTQILQAESARQEVLRQIEELDISECKEIDEGVQKVKAKQGRLSRKNDQINRQIGAHENEIRSMAVKLEGLANAREEKDKQAEIHLDILSRYAKQWHDFAMEDALAAIRQRDLTMEAATKIEGENFGARLNQHTAAVERGLEKFNEMRLRGTTIDYSRFLEQNLLRGQNRENLTTCFSFACDLTRQARAALNFLRNDILAKHKAKLTDMTQQFNTTFISHLCHSLHNAVRDGKAKLDALNRKLRDHYFGEEYYRFEYKWIPEFREYDKFFREAVMLDSGSGVSLFSRDVLSKESRRIFTEICNKLLDPDVERSIEDLRRIADYRNYRSYDIKKCLPDRELSLKTYGSGSGGQMETPSYVIRSAGLSSALRFGEGYSHLKTVLIDESFSKMDEQRCKAVIDYLANKLGFQILFVVPTMKAGALHDHVDQVVQVTKLPTDHPRGELNTTVLVTANQLKKRRVIELWQKERLSIENKAHQLNFLELIDG